MSSSNDVKLLKEAFCDFFQKVLALISDNQELVKSKWVEFRDYLLNDAHDALSIFLFAQKMQLGTTNLRLADIQVKHCDSPISPTAFFNQRQQGNNKPYLKDLRHHNRIQTEMVPNIEQKRPTIKYDLKLKYVDSPRCVDESQRRQQYSAMKRKYSQQHLNPQPQKFFPPSIKKELLNFITLASQQFTKNQSILQTVYAKSHDINNSAMLDDTIEFITHDKEQKKQREQLKRYSIYQKKKDTSQNKIPSETLTTQTSGNISYREQKSQKLCL